MIRPVRFGYGENTWSKFAGGDVAHADSSYKTVRNKLAEVEKELEEKKALLEKKKNELSSLYDELGGKWPELRRLHDYLTGKITHFVTYRTSGNRSFDPPSIIEFDKLMKYSPPYVCDNDYKLKLLSLYGSPDGDVAWYVNSYHDGSGYWMHVSPATSFDEAVDIAVRYAEESIRAIADGALENMSEMSKAKRVVSNAHFIEKHNRSVSDDLVDYVKESRRKVLTSEMEAAMAKRLGLLEELDLVYKKINEAKDAIEKL